MRKESEIKQKALKFMAAGLRNSAEVAAGSQCLYITFEPKIPEALKKASK